MEMREYQRNINSARNFHFYDIRMFCLEIGAPYTEAYNITSPDNGALLLHNLFI